VKGATADIVGALFFKYCVLTDDFDQIRPLSDRQFGVSLHELPCLCLVSVAAHGRMRSHKHRTAMNAFLLAREEYHAHPAISATKLKAAMNLTSSEYWRKHVDPNRAPFQPSDDMRKGSLADLLITQPDHFEDAFLIKPDFDFRTKPSKELYASIFGVEYPGSKVPLPSVTPSGQEVITQKWIDQAKAVKARLLADPVIARIIAAASPALSQQPFFWEEGERQFRMMGDLISEERTIFPLVHDLKKTRSADPRDFQNQAFEFGYDIQAWHYIQGYKAKTSQASKGCSFIVYEWPPSTNYAIVDVDEYFLAMGERRWWEALDRIEEWEDSGLYPSFGRYTITAPKWTPEGRSGSAY